MKNRRAKVIERSQAKCNERKKMLKNSPGKEINSAELMERQKGKSERE